MRSPNARRLRAVPAMLFSVTAFALVGCSPSRTATPTGIAHNTNSLVWGIAGLVDVPTLDPSLASDPTSIAVTSLIYGGLVRLDDRLRVEPDGASRWTISHGGTVYTFHLRPNLRFASGRIATAADFVQSLDRALGPQGTAGPAPVYLGLIAHKRSRPDIIAVDSRTVRITLVHSAAHFLSELAFPASFVPDLRLIGRYGDGWTNYASGFGPYRVAEWDHTRSLTLVANAHYWAGRPAFSRIRIYTYQSPTEAIAAYQRGAVDVVSGFTPGVPVSARPEGLLEVPGLALDYLAFNTARTPFTRRNVRLALAAVARQSQPSSTLQGAAFPARNVLPSAFEVGQPVWTAPASAPHLLSTARYPGGRSFPPIVLVAPRDPGLMALGHALAGVWSSNLHITVQVQGLNPSNYNAVLAHGTFDAALVRWGADYPDPQDFLGTQLGTSSDNVTGWSTRRYQHLVSLADSYNPDDPRRVRLFASAIAIVQAKAPLVPLDEPAIPVLIRPALRGVVMTGLGAISIDVLHARYVES